MQVHSSMEQRPMVSIIIPTKNSAETIRRTLVSIKNQSYKNLEIIIVDNNSTDSTIKLAKEILQDIIIVQGKGERSEQKNDGARVASGKYLYFIDSDFVLQRDVIKEAVELGERGADAVIIHNTSDPSKGYWAKVRKLERDCYENDPEHVAARFVRKDLFFRVGGYDELLVAGEDYDLHARLLKMGVRTAWAKNKEYHIGEPSTLKEIVLKHVYYGKFILRYVRKELRINLSKLFPFRIAYVRHLDKFVSQPKLIPGFLLYQFVRYSAAIAGSLASTPMLSFRTFSVNNNANEYSLLHNVSIVVVTRNREGKFKKCMESILKDSDEAEIIVIDDASEKDYVSRLDATIRVVRNKRRLLLNESRNLGARLAKNEYILFIDDDNILEKGTILTLTKTLSSMSYVAVACPLTVDSSGRVWHTFGKVGKFSGLVVFDYRGYQSSSIHRGIKEVETFHNCFMFRKDVFFKFGGFDSVNFPMYLAELDLAEKIRKHGYKIVVNTACKVIHEVDYSLFRNVHITEPVRAYMVGRNRILFMRKHRSTGVYLLFLLLFQPVYFLTHLYLILTSGETRKGKNYLIGAYVRGMLDGIIRRVKYGTKLLMQSNIEFREAL